MIFFNIETGTLFCSYFVYGPTYYIKAKNEPPIAPVTTMTQGGSFQKASILNKIAAKAKSIGAKIELVHIGK